MLATPTRSDELAQHTHSPGAPSTLAAGVYGLLVFDVTSKPITEMIIVFSPAIE